MAFECQHVVLECAPSRSGLGPTAFGYFVQGWFKFGGVEFFKVQAAERRGTFHLPKGPIVYSRTTTCTCASCTRPVASFTVNKIARVSLPSVKP